MTTNTPPKQSDDLVQLGDKRVESTLVDRYKGIRNQTDRIAIISSSLIRGNSHFLNKRSFRCLSTKDRQAICCDQLGSPQQRFGFLLFQYIVDEKGELLDDSKLQGKIKMWLITESRYEELTQIHKSWPLMDYDPKSTAGGFGVKQHDLMIKCTEENYQKMQFTPCPSAHWKVRQDWYDVLKGRDRMLKDRLKLALGKQLTELEVMELLGVVLPGANANSPGSGAADIDLSSIIEGGE